MSDIDAATAVVRRYYALLNELRVDMDATSLAALMTPTCPCREQIRAIQNASRRGQHYIDQVHLVSVTPGRDSPIQVTVLVEYNADAGGLVDAHGHFVTHSPPTRGVRRLFEVRRLTTGAWRIAEIDAL